jgi:hypothetical protein
MRRAASLPGLATLAIVMSLTAPVARASLFRALDLRELTAAAEQIVVADVLRTASDWDAAHRTIHTTIDIMVRDSWKGPPPANGRITLRQLGGRVGDIEMSVHGMATFAAGERVLLFLERSRVVGMAQGKRTLRWSDAARRWLVEPAESGGVPAAPTSPGSGASTPAGAEDLDTLRGRVRDLLRSGP